MRQILRELKKIQNLEIFFSLKFAENPRKNSRKAKKKWKITDISPLLNG